jgi:hypothetical protein
MGSVASGLVKIIIFKVCFVKVTEFTFDCNLAVNPSDVRIPSQLVVCIVYVRCCLTLTRQRMYINHHCPKHVKALLLGTVF